MSNDQTATELSEVEQARIAGMEAMHAMALDIVESFREEVKRNIDDNAEEGIEPIESLNQSYNWLAHAAASIRDLLPQKTITPQVLTLDEIIQHLETATAPDPVLDGMIWRIAAPEGEWYDMGNNVWMKQDPLDQIAFDGPPRYTERFDDAMLLVDALGFEWLHKAQGVMSVYNDPYDDKTWAVHHDARAANLPMALCLAALRCLKEQTP